MRWFKTLNHLAGNLFAQQAFNGANGFDLVGRGKRERFSGRHGSGGPADAVDIVFRPIGNVKIHHMGNTFNVKATRGNIGCD